MREEKNVIWQDLSIFQLSAGEVSQKEFSTTRPQCNFLFISKSHNAIFHFISATLNNLYVGGTLFYATPLLGLPLVRAEVTRLLIGKMLGLFCLHRHRLSHVLRGVLDGRSCRINATQLNWEDFETFLIPHRGKKKSAESVCIFGFSLLFADYFFKSYI